MSKRKKVKVLEFHQHRDIGGNIFGKSHLVTAIHKNGKTQIRHEITQLIEGGKKYL